MKVNNLISIVMLAVLMIVSFNSCKVLEGEAGTPSDSSTNESELEVQEPSEVEEDRIYGNYRIITVDNVEIKTLVEAMFSHQSWFNVNAQSSQSARALAFEEYVMKENEYLLELLSREDGIDLLLWQYDKIARDPMNYQTPISSAGINLYYCVFSETVQQMMSEEQKIAAEAMKYHISSGRNMPAGTKISFWKCNKCDSDMRYYAFDDEVPSYCMNCEEECEFIFDGWLYK